MQRALIKAHRNTDKKYRRKGYAQTTGRISFLYAHAHKSVSAACAARRRTRAAQRAYARLESYLPEKGGLYEISDTGELPYHLSSA